MRIAGLVHVRDGGVRLCNFVRVIAGNQGGNRFATRKYCGAEPEHGPSRHQPHAREPAQTPWPAGFRLEKFDGYSGR